MDPTIPKKYDLNLTIDNKKVPMVPFILNTCGNIVTGAIHDLENVGDEGITKHIECRIDPTNSEQMLFLKVNEIEIKIKPFVQQMIWKTITGFLSTLKKIPENLEELPLTLTIQRKL